MLGVGGANEPRLGRGLIDVPTDEDSSHANPDAVRPEETDPLDRGGRGKRLVDFGEAETFAEPPKRVFESFRIALGRRRGGVAAAGYMTGEAGINAWVVGPTETVDARGRARLTSDRVCGSVGRDEDEATELRFDPILNLSVSCIPNPCSSDDNRSWFIRGELEMEETTEGDGHSLESRILPNSSTIA